MSKGRTRQLASHDVSVAFFRAWLERGVWVKPPKVLRLSGDWLWYVVRALHGIRESSKAFQEVVREMYTTYGWTLLQTLPCLAYFGRFDSLAGWQGISTQKVSPAHWMRSMRRSWHRSRRRCSHVRRSLEGVHMALDAKHMENLASLLEVKGAKPSPTPSSRATGRGQRDVLELLKAAEATVFRRGTGIALYLLEFATKELAQDMQTPSKLSMLRLRRFVRYLLGAADVNHILHLIFTNK